MEGSGTMFGDKIQLYGEQGFFLKISENGGVSGTQDNVDSYTHLHLLSGNDIGTVKIKGLQTGLYLCFVENGALCGKTDPESSGTTFKEDFYGSYTSYESVEYPGWFIGISKKGQVKNGNRTQPKKKSTKFLSIRF